MAITYNEIRRTTETWGIDITCQFNGDGKGGHSTEIYRAVTFRFDNQKQIDDEYDTRMGKAIQNIQDDLDEPLEKSQEQLKEESDDAIVYIKTSLTLPQVDKDALLAILETNVDIREI